MPTLRAPVEIRTAGSVPRLRGTILQEGRAAAGGRAEVFAPGSVVWPESGVGIQTEHYGPIETRAVPVREPDGRLVVDTVATSKMVEAVAAGKRFLSVEFYPTAETRTKGGVREVRRALVDSAALTDDPEYTQAKAEIRERKGRRLWL